MLWIFQVDKNVGIWRKRLMGHVDKHFKCCAYFQVPMKMYNKINKDENIFDIDISFLINI